MRRTYPYSNDSNPYNHYNPRTVVLLHIFLVCTLDQKCKNGVVRTKPRHFNALTDTVFQLFNEIAAHTPFAITIHHWGNRFNRRLLIDK